MKKTLISLLLIALFLVGIKPVHAIAAPPGVEVSFPNEALDCGVWPDGPVRSGGYVVNTAYVTCATAHPWIKVVAGIQCQVVKKLVNPKLAMLFIAVMSTLVFLIYPISFGQRAYQDILMVSKVITPLGLFQPKIRG